MVEESWRQVINILSRNDILINKPKEAIKELDHEA